MTPGALLTTAPAPSARLSAARRRELGACLRAYRGLIEPASVGLPAGARRRGPGLRREELASLAGVSLTWYTGLEQGRVAASAQVLDAVGRVLRLDEVGRRHLRRLGAPEPRERAASDSQLRAVAPLVDGWRDGPAALLDHRLDVAAVNTAWVRLFGDPAEYEPARRHLLWLVAGAPAGARGLLLPVARQFRMAADLHPADPRIIEVAALLRADHPRLTPVWDCRGVGAFGRPAVDLAGEPAAAHLLHPTGEPGIALLVAATACAEIRAAAPRREVTRAVLPA
ncbi:Helix-turn-helix domain [Frankia sp. AiPs1]|uniref:helix-turn-helix domain-containing protein n=1 Tax=Frankia sp. AiPa1 TaxID=573492 RepID=UPI00202B6FDC|nr:helix-turn-helix domain-containing protein [Frankia sp. AiPa1]MCL9762604.1 helix-turn-helix domain-containing protein [Frankia sp. AiPa1]